MSSSLNNNSLIVNNTQEITGISNTLNDSANEIVTSGGLMDFLYEHGILSNTATVTIIAKDTYNNNYYDSYVSCGGEYTIGSTATVVATSTTDFAFAAWQDSQGNNLSTSATYSFTVTGDVILTALFQQYGSGGSIN